jgi:hypothetical protein
MKNDLPVNSYIVRIYRKGKDQPRVLVGIVEEAGTAEKRAFTTFDELWEILTRKRAGRLQRRQGSDAL